MDPSRWQRINELFHAALERPHADRAAFVTAACADDDALRGEVGQLLLAHDEALAVRATSRFANALAASTSDDPELPAGARLGAYRIVREIGRGGMGVVYLAERADQQYTKQVAIKLIKRGVDTDAVLALFRHERQILAGLDHPNITRLLDAGTASDGRPYFVMEYVEGTPIHEYCDVNTLTIAQRLELFRRVCAAVSHAHRHLVVHRDLKPSNILVTASGEPKLLDFGIAKLMDPDREGALTVVSAVGLMTPEYASPEQRRGLPVTTLSDVYSLGLVLYELLSGRKASPRSLLSDDADPPTKPSKAVTAEVCASRRTTFDRLQRMLSGDLDTITLTALHAGAAGRYQSVEQFADDINRHLTRRPILARRDAPLYRTLKFIRRNAVASAAVLLIASTLVGGAVATKWQALAAEAARAAAVHERDRAVVAEKTAQSERDRALRAEQVATVERQRAQHDRNRAVEQSTRADNEAAIANAVRQFLEADLLARASAAGQAEGNLAPDADLKVRDLLDRAAARIGGRFDTQPLVEAAIRQTMGIAYKSMGLYDDAESQLERALALRSRVLGRRHLDTLTTMHDLAAVYRLDGRAADAQRVLVEAVDGLRSLRGEDDRNTLAALNTLAIMSSGRQREELLHRVLAVQRRVLGADHPDRLGVMNNLASLYVDQGRYLDGEKLYTEIVEAKRRVLGPEHPSTLLSMHTLGVTYRFLGRYTEAESLLRVVLEKRRRAFGAEHLDTLVTMNSLALVFVAQERYAEGDVLLNQVLSARKRVHGEEHPNTMGTVNNLAELYRRTRRYAESEELIRRVVDVAERTRGPDSVNMLNALSALGELKFNMGEYAQAEKYLREALTGYERINSEAWRRYYTQSMLGQILAVIGRRSEAQPALAGGYAEMVKRQGTIPAENRAVIANARSWLGQLSADGNPRSPTPDPSVERRPPTR